MPFLSQFPRNILGFILLIVMGSAAGWLLFETALTLAGYNSYIFFSGLPNHTFRHVTFEFDATYHQNEFGFRSPNHAIPKPRDVFRIVVLGDSYTYGIGVDDDQVYSRILEKHLSEGPIPEPWRRVEVINLGIPNRAVGDYLLYFEHLGLLYEPDLTIVAVFSGNDVTDYLAASIPMADTMTSKDGLYFGARNVLRILTPRTFKLLRSAKKQWKYRNLVKLRPDVPWDRQDLDRFLRAGGMDSVAVHHALQQAPTQMIDDVLNNRIFRPTFARWLSGDSASPLDPRTFDAQKETTQRYLERIFRLARQNHSEILVCNVPSPFLVTDLSHTMWKAIPTSSTVLSQATEFIHDVSLANRVSYLDLSDSLHHRSREGTTVYYPYDLHWTEAGHAIAARTILAKIVEGKLLRHPRNTSQTP